MHCRMLSSVSGLYPLDANSTHPSVVISTSVSRCYQIFSGGKMVPVETKKEKEREIREGGRLRQGVLNLVAYSIIPGSGDNA